MELEEFHKDFLEAVRSVASSEGDFEKSAFVSEATRRMIEAEELSEFDPCFHEGTGSRNRRLRVDGFSFDDVDGSARLIVANYRGTEQIESLTQSECIKIFGALQAFVEDSLSGRLIETIEESSPGYGLAFELHRHRDSITRLRLYLLTDASLSSRVKGWPEASINDYPVEYHIWDITRFHRIFESAVGRDILEVDFTEFAQSGIPCLKASRSTEGYEAYLCVIPGTILAEIYNRYGSRLLEGNVRSFLSTRGKVNKAIRVSILNEPNMFFAYNNGIAATAIEAVVEPNIEGLWLKKATYLQIVNGGQTTASLANTSRKDKADLSNIYVQMKLLVVSPSSADEIIPRISFCANSQNKVNDADFFSNHPFHVRIEEHSRRIWAPAVNGAQHETRWFYERARGQYLNEQVHLTPAEKRRFLQQHPRNQVITKTDLAKFENVWMGIPHIVSLGAQKNFVEFAKRVNDSWKQSDAEFNEEYFRDVVSRSLLFHYTERLVSRQSWYQGGYRANIVAYTVSKLSELVKTKGSGKSLDLRGIWARQYISEALDAQLTHIAFEVFNVIINPDVKFQNITEWCKKELCWEKVRSLDLPLFESLSRELVTQDDVMDMRRKAKVQQKIDTGISAQAEVFNLGSEYWEKLLVWGRKQRVLSGEQERLVSVATRMPHIIPDARQSAKLLNIKNRVEEEGFRSGLRTDAQGS